MTVLVREAMLAVTAFACVAPPAETGAVLLRASSPEADVEAPRATDGLLSLEIVRVINPARHAFNLLLVAGEDEVVARLAPFPPDRRARFAIRARPRSGRLRVRLERVDGRPLPDLVEVRVESLARRR